MSLLIVQDKTPEELTIALESSNTLPQMMQFLNEVRDVTIKTIKKIKAVEEVVVYEYEAVWDAETSTFTIEELELPTPAADIIKVFKGKGEGREESNYIFASSSGGAFSQFLK